MNVGPGLSIPLLVSMGEASRWGREERRCNLIQEEGASGGVSLSLPTAGEQEAGRSISSAARTAAGRG